MESPSTGWWSSATRRIHRMLGRARAASTPGEELTTSLGSAIDDSLTWLQRVSDDPLVRDVIREHYGRRAGGQQLEFLLACSSFENARNPLQRFEQFRNIINKFVHQGAERAVSLPELVRAQLLHDWSRWSHGNRLPVSERIPALQAAVKSVRSQLTEQRHG